MQALAAASADELEQVEGVGKEVAKSIRRWFASEHGRAVIDDLAACGVNMTQPRRQAASDALAGKTVVITGTLQKYTRSQIEDLVKQHGGKTSGSVSKKTDYVVAGAEAGSKLAKAKELGVPVLDEAAFDALIGA
jgi:DNA ligase (NAD+)